MRPVYWTKSRCKEFADSCSSFSEFYNTSAYAACFQNGWLDEVCVNLPRNPPRNKGVCKWSKEDCVVEASKYKTRSSFKKGANHCYVICRRNGWLDEVCDHMVHGRKRSNCLYIWRINGTDFYKVGIGNIKTVRDRIRDCAKSNQATADIILIKQRPNPRKTEAALIRRYGVLIDILKYGKTEIIRLPRID